MKFATIAASVLVASSVLATAGVVSANATDNGAKTATGTASVNVTNEGGQLNIDKAPGANTVDADGKTITGASFAFPDTTIAELAKGAAQKTATLNAGTFQVTDTTANKASWTLTAKLSSFKAGDTPMDSTNLKIGNAVLTTGDTNASTLFDSNDTAGTWTNNKTTWANAKTDAVLTVPSTAKIGEYQANIVYNLSVGVGDTAK